MFRILLCFIRYFSKLCTATQATALTQSSTLILHSVQLTDMSHFSTRNGFHPTAYFLRVQRHVACSTIVTLPFTTFTCNILLLNFYVQYLPVTHSLSTRSIVDAKLSKSSLNSFFSFRRLRFIGKRFPPLMQFSRHGGLLQKCSL